MQWYWPWFSTPVQLMHSQFVEVTVVFRRKSRDCLLFHIHLPLHDVCSNLCFRCLSWFKDFTSKCLFFGFFCSHHSTQYAHTLMFSDIFRTTVWLGQVRHFWVWLHHRFLWFNPKWKVRETWFFGSCLCLNTPSYLWLWILSMWGITEADDWFYGIYLQTLPYF